VSAVRQKDSKKTAEGFVKSDRRLKKMDGKHTAIKGAKSTATMESSNRGQNPTEDYAAVKVPRTR